MFTGLFFWLTQIFNKENSGVGQNVPRETFLVECVTTARMRLVTDWLKYGLFWKKGTISAKIKGAKIFERSSYESFNR